jgi:cyclopropane fatty-acyl-phospholipid synthase-like methyltransferase
MVNTQRALMVGPADMWDMKRDYQIYFLKEMGMKPEHTVMDMGCGVLRGGIPMIDYLNEGNYYGFEVRDHVLKEGVEELKEAYLEHKNPVLLSENAISDLNIEAKFDYMWAFSVLIHMTDDIVLECLKFAAEHLKDTGAFYANVTKEEPKGNAWLEFPVLHRSIEEYAKFAEQAGLCVKSIGQLKDLGHNTNRPEQDAQHMLKFTKE